jgi:imidazolonepropionase-like amidohydrolase
MTTLRLFSAFLLFLLAPYQSPSNATTQIAVTHVTIIDVRSGSTTPDMSVLITGNRISAIGPSKETPLPAQAREIDVHGQFLIPGLWDMHVHSDGDSRALARLLASGITGVRDMGGDISKLAETRRRINSGDLPGPQIRFAGPRLNGPPAQPDSDVLVIHSADEARRAVNSLADQHVDFIKVHDGLSRDSFLAIVAAAKSRDLPFEGHVPESMTPLEVSDLGQKSIEHLEFVPKSCHARFESGTGSIPRNLPAGCEPQSLDSLFHHFEQNGTWLDPTIQSFRYWAPTQWNAIFVGFRELVPSIRANHVSILAGTDWSGFLEEKGALPGICLHDELELLVEAGFTRLEAIQAATLNPAVFFGLSDSLGTVETGRIADLVLLEGNPLVDIRNTKRIAAVFSKGKLLDRRMLNAMSANASVPTNSIH